jgi:hypothetical protein
METTTPATSSEVGATSDDAERANLRHNALKVIERETKTAPCFKHWEVLGASQRIRQVPSDPEKLLCTLCGNFPGEALIRENILKSGPNGTLQLSAAFGTPNGCFVLTYADGRIVNAQSASGSLTDPTADLVSAVKATSSQTFAPLKPLLLARDSDEQFVFGRLRLEVMPRFACYPLTGAFIKQLYTARPPASSPFRTPNDPRYKYWLTFSGWQVKNFVNRPHPDVVELIEQLGKLPAYYGFDPDTLFRFWLPSQAELAKMRGVRKFRDKDLLRKTVRASLQASCYTAREAAIILRDRTPTTFADGLRKVEALIDESAEVPLFAEVSSMLEKTNAAFEREFIAPIAATSPGDTDVQVMLKHEIARLGREWKDSLDLMTKARGVLRWHCERHKPLRAARNLNETGTNPRGRRPICATN